MKKDISKLKARIILAGFDQVDVAAETGIDEQRISAFVRKRRFPREEEVTILAKVLKCKEEEIRDDLGL